jgi:hypothetical protein
MTTATEAPAPLLYRLLPWAAGLTAVVLCLSAFLWWGYNGVTMLFDMIVALCT